MKQNKGYDKQDKEPSPVFTVPKIPWSRWSDYDSQYLVYQKELRSCIEGYDPLRWEFKYWMKEARHLADEK